MKINRYLSQNYKADLDAYQRKVEASKTLLKPGSLSDPMPPRPKRVQVLVPGNITSSKLIGQMADNGSQALVVVETEADVVAGSFKTDHGSQISTILRQAFHHEPVGLSRKTNDELVEVEQPKLAMILAGTDNQIMAIFRGGNQDGLFSRFMFLRNLTSIEWRSIKPDRGAKALDDHYNEWSEWFFNVWQQTRDFQAEVTFTERQWDLLDALGQRQQATAHLAGGEYSVSIARRHALMVVRIALILSLFRRVDPDSGKVNTSLMTWVCDDVDFELAITLIEVSFQNSLELFRAMPQTKDANFSNIKRMAFFSALPTNFQMRTVNAVASTHQVPERTKTRWISDFCATGMLEQIGRGEYRKTAMAAVASMAVSQ